MNGTYALEILGLEELQYPFTGVDVESGWTGIHNKCHWICMRLDELDYN